MVFDLKSLSVLVGIASAVVGLAFKLMPRSEDRLKRDLELLKLARDAKANHLPLQRHVEAQINEAYVKAGLGLLRKAGMVVVDVAFASIFTVGLMLIVGAVIVLGAKALSSLTDQSAGQVMAGCLAFGIFMGLVVGLGEAQKAINAARREIEERERITLLEDEEALRKANASNDT